MSGEANNDPMVPCQTCGAYPDPELGEMHRADCPTLTSPHAIVRELAEQGPFLDDTTDCAMCDRRRPHGVGSQEWFGNPANHEPSCLWRRAKAMYPGSPS